jgi:four helix bundle protein
VFRFERLDVWHKSAVFANRVYEATKAFPRAEQFGLTSQLRRCAASISANIAEGSSRNSDRDFSRFVEIAYGSLCETVSYLFLAKSQCFMSPGDCGQLYKDAEELGRMLSAFRNTLGEWKTLPESES